MRQLKKVSLEMSLKPFRSMDPEFVVSVCKRMFNQWLPLIRHADVVSVLFWTGDGSELLDYRGSPDDEFEWAKFIGNPNPETQKWSERNDPRRESLHARAYLYMENPPAFTYRDLKMIVDTVRHIGVQTTGKPVLVGTTFDPGPEFAISDFKFRRHREILLGGTMGRNTFVCCYSKLHADNKKYAGFPDGIPEGTPFGTFFGRQSQHFMTDIGFDFLWLSNGFGFGMETWRTNGVIFDGERFDNSIMKDVKRKIIEFWELFRQECPHFPLETRGTNLSTGIDLASDGTPLKDIYDGNFNILPPPNSPWAALNGDFGLELSGYMSRIAELPGEDYLFRYYLHDPWWVNSPWIDRYGGEPHDIYLPLAVSRINGSGETVTPSHLSLLTVDDSYGRMPERCPNEIIPHLLKAYEHAPDAPAPLVWVYPFDEYHKMAEQPGNKVNEVFFGDWYIRGAIEHGLPLASVVSSGIFVKTSTATPDLYGGSVIVTIVPDAGSELEERIIRVLEAGGSVMLYGPVDRAGDTMLKLLNVRRESPLNGPLRMELLVRTDELEKPAPDVFEQKSVYSGGGLETVLLHEDDPHTKPLAYGLTLDGTECRIAALSRTKGEWNGGTLVWVRGANSSRFTKDWRVPDNPDKLLLTEPLMRLALSEFGYQVRYTKRSASVRSPLTMVHRHKNGFYFSGYVPDTTASMRLKFPFGAPLLLGTETRLADGCASYHMPRAWFKECRLFVEQDDDTILSCNEFHPVSWNKSRRTLAKGLSNAIIRYFPETPFEESTELLLNSPYPHVIGEPLEVVRKASPWGTYFEAKGVSGTLMISR